MNRIVRIDTPDQQGSGLRVNATHVLTCEHVIREDSQPLVNGKPCRRIVAVSQSTDLALLETEPEPLELPPLVWLDDIPLQTPLSIRGFVNGEARVVACTVLATHGAERGCIEVELPAGVKPGHSGGPALAAEDEHVAIGIVVMGGDYAFKSGLIGSGTVCAFLKKCEIAVRQVGHVRERHYLDRLRQRTGFLDLKNLKVKGSDALNPEIEELYIQLETSNVGKSTDERGGVTFHTAHLSRLPLEATVDGKRILIQGEAGSGKSTFLHRIAFELAGGGHGFPVPLPIPGFFPILAKVADLEKALGSGPLAESPEEFREFLATTHGLPALYFRNRLSAETTILLLDGLDESPEPQRRNQTLRLVEALARENPCTIIATTRPRAGVNLEGFARHEILPLTPAARKKFLHDWSRYLYQKKAADSAEDLTAMMLEALALRPEIEELTTNPLMLTALAALYWAKRRLPEQRAELYESILEWLAESRHPGERARRCLDHLGAIAYAMQTSPQGRQKLIERGEAAGILTREEAFLNNHEAAHFLNTEEVESGIIRSNGDALEFWHLTFLEFLVARTLAGWGDEEQYEAIFQGARLYAFEWREVMRLYAGLLRRQGPKKVDRLIKKIIDHAVGQDLARRTSCVALLDRIQHDLRAAQYEIKDERHPALLASMEDLFRRTTGPPAELWERLEAAEALGEKHPLLRLPGQPDYWVRLDGGEFTMGAQKNDPRAPNYDPAAHDDEPVRTLRIGPFGIGRFPVTVFEYAEYLARTGKAAPHEWENQCTHPSRPVVIVSWDDAEAYAKWAGARLPTEEEWEFAARGNVARRYPWGDDPEPDDQLANFNMNCGAPSPVGLFPEGATPEGICDLAGNVWEWTSSDYDADRNTVRGGAFRNAATYLRAAYRYGFGPDFRFDDLDDLGFRRRASTTLRQPAWEFSDFSPLTLASAAG